MNQNRFLGFAAILAAPFLFIDFMVHGTGAQYQSTSLSGVFNLIYMLGWCCSIIGLLRLNATGSNPPGKMILLIQLSFLAIANVWNIWVIIQPDAHSVLFQALDFFWPISNAFMLVTGIAVIRAKRLKGRKRYVPFVVGLWLPLGIVLTNLLFNGSYKSMLITGLYSAIAWMWLGYVVAITVPDKKKLLFAGNKLAYQLNKENR